MKEKAFFVILQMLSYREIKKRADKKSPSYCEWIEVFPTAFFPQSISTRADSQLSENISKKIKLITFFRQLFYF